MVLAVFGRRFAAEFPEYPVKVGEAYKAAFQGDVGDLFRSVEQKKLAVADPYPLNILGKGISCDPPELVGQIIRAHIRFPCEPVQRHILPVMGVDIVGYGIDPFRNLVGYLAFFIDIAVLKLAQVIKEADKKAVKNKLFCPGELLRAERPLRLVLKCQIYHLVDQIGEDSQLLLRETIDGNIPVKGREKFFIGVLESEVIFRIHKCDDQPFGRLFFRVTGFVEKGRGQEHEIMALYRVRHSFQKVDGIGA